MLILYLTYYTVIKYDIHKINIQYMDNGFVDLPNGGEFLIGMDQTRSADQYKYARSFALYSLQ